MFDAKQARQLVKDREYSYELGEILEVIREKAKHGFESMEWVELPLSLKIELIDLGFKIQKNQRNGKAVNYIISW